MTWGRGHGTPFGGGPVVATDQPTSAVGGDPTGFDFTDEADGPLPGKWEFFNVQTAAGIITTEPEPIPQDITSPQFFFSISDGFGWWHYERNPLVGDPFDQRGYLASPSNVVTGRNALAAVAARQPRAIIDTSQGDFTYEVALALRGNGPLDDYIGARMRAEWSAGVWTTPIALEIIRQTIGGGVTVLATATVEPLPDPTDLWAAGPNDLAELEVEVRNDIIIARLNGVLQVSATAPSLGGSKVGVFVKVFQVKGGFAESIPAVAGATFQTLRDLEKLGAPPAIEGGRHIEAPQIERTYFLPIREWLGDLNFVKRTGARTFEALIDFDATVDESRIGLRIGDVIRAVEPYVGQELTKAVLDLHAARGRGSLC